MTKLIMALLVLCNDLTFFKSGVFSTTPLTAPENLRLLGIIDLPLSF